MEASVLEDNIDAYYDAVDELNEKYNAEITMPSRNEIADSGILDMSVDEFKNEVERQYLEVTAFDDGNVEVVSIADDSGASICSSGVKTQNCYMKDGNGDKVGVLFLTANVVEAGVNQYTSVISTGVKSESTTDYYFKGYQSTYSLSSDYKSCTVNYSGYFVNDVGVSLTLMKTYTVTYQVNAGDYVLYVSKPV